MDTERGPGPARGNHSDARSTPTAQVSGAPVNAKGTTLTGRPLAPCP